MLSKAPRASWLISRKSHEIIYISPSLGRQMGPCRVLQDVFSAQDVGSVPMDTELEPITLRCILLIQMVAAIFSASSNCFY